MKTIEIIADKGHLFVLRECDDEDGCVVLEQWIGSPPPLGDPLDRAPAHDMHIPADVLPELIKALQSQTPQGGEA